MSARLANPRAFEHQRVHIHREVVVESRGRRGRPRGQNGPGSRSCPKTWRQSLGVLRHPRGFVAGAQSSLQNEAGASDRESPTLLLVRSVRRWLRAGSPTPGGTLCAP